MMEPLFRCKECSREIGATPEEIFFVILCESCYSALTARLIEAERVVEALTPLLKVVGEDMRVRGDHAMAAVMQWGLIEDMHNAYRTAYPDKVEGDTP